MLSLHFCKLGVVKQVFFTNTKNRKGPLFNIYCTSCSFRFTTRYLGHPAQAYHELKSGIQYVRRGGKCGCFDSHVWLYRCQSVTAYSYLKWCLLPRIFQNRLVGHWRIQVMIGLINMLVCWTRVLPEIRSVTACVTAATFLTERVDHGPLMSGYRESGMWMCCRKVKFEKVRVSTTALATQPPLYR